MRNCDYVLMFLTACVSLRSTSDLIKIKNWKIEKEKWSAIKKSKPLPLIFRREH